MARGRDTSRRKPRSDKGARRARYTMRRRQARSEFTAARDALEAERLAAYEGRREGRSRSERRAEARRASLPDDRVCPGCGEVKVDSRRWVVIGDEALCLSCHRTRRHGNGGE